jgi:hypothetical protein
LRLGCYPARSSQLLFGLVTVHRQDAAHEVDDAFFLARDPRRRCDCSRLPIEKYVGKISSSLLDRSKAITSSHLNEAINDRTLDRNYWT